MLRRCLATRSDGCRGEGLEIRSIHLIKEKPFMQKLSLSTKTSNHAIDLQQEDESVLGDIPVGDVDARANPTLALEIIVFDGEIWVMRRLQPG